jgi:hypothetical protein
MARPARVLVVNASAGRASLSGTPLANANVGSIQSPSIQTVAVELSDISFADAVFSSTAMRTALARSLAVRHEGGGGGGGVPPHSHSAREPSRECARTECRAHRAPSRVVRTERRPE